MLDVLRRESGLAFMDSIMAAVIMLTGVLSLSTLFTFGAEVVDRNRQKTVAAHVAAQEIEQIRSLSFLDVGLVSGNPPGILQPSSSRTAEGVEFSVKTRIHWIDDEKDGLAPTDADPRDYKRADVTISWQSGSKLREYELSTVVAKQSQDQITQGGNIDVLVKDIYDMVVEDVYVEVTEGPSAPITDYSDEYGKVFFPALDPSVSEGDYSLQVSKTGYVVRPDLTIQTTTVVYRETRALEFIISRPGAMTITLVDPGGNQIDEAASVTLSSPYSGDELYSESTGYFEVNNLFPGSWQLAPVTASYEYTGDPIIVDVDEQATENVTIVMTPRPQGRLILTSYDSASSNPLPYTAITLTDTSSGAEIVTETSAAADLSIGLDAGVYDILAEKTGYFAETDQVTIVDNTTSTVDMYLDPAPTYGSFLVTTERRDNGDPRPDIWVRVTNRTTYNQWKQTDSQGEALFANLVPGTYRSYRWRNGWRNRRTREVVAGQQATVTYKW